MPSKEIPGLFFTRQDEADFSSRLREAISTVGFLDTDRSRPPKLISSIAAASGVQAWIFSATGDAPLTWESMPPTIQFLRCREHTRDGRKELRVGRMAIVYDDVEVRPFLAAVWKVFRKMCNNQLAAYSLPGHRPGDVVRDIWLGPDARTWHEAGGLLASNAANLYYAPQS